MTSLQRVFTISAGKVPDRLPIWETLIDWHVVGELRFYNLRNVEHGCNMPRTADV